MPELKWNETDFIECLEVTPKEEDDVSYFFKVIRNGLCLTLNLFQYDSVVYFDLYREGNDDPLFSFGLFVRGAIEYKKEKDREYLLFQNALPVPSSFTYYDYEEDIRSTEDLSYRLDLVLSVNPDIKINFERYRT